MPGGQPTKYTPELAVAIAEEQPGPPPNKGGRPLAYESEEELSTAIDEYFESCSQTIIESKKDKEDKEITREYKVQTRPYTMTALALALGITRFTLINYGKENRYFHTVSRAKQVCEAYSEEQLFRKQGSTKGVEFSLKNNYKGWVDKKEVEWSGTVQHAHLHASIDSRTDAALGISSTPKLAGQGSTQSG